MKTDQELLEEFGTGSEDLIKMFATGYARKYPIKNDQTCTEFIEKETENFEHDIEGLRSQLFS